MALWRDTVEAATQTQSRDRALLQTTMMRPGGFRVWGLGFRMPLAARGGGMAASR